LLILVHGLAVCIECEDDTRRLGAERHARPCMTTMVSGRHDGLTHLDSQVNSSAVRFSFYRAKRDTGSRPAAGSGALPKIPILSAGCVLVRTHARRVGVGR
jgi:hypothetical protein